VAARRLRRYVEAAGAIEAETTPAQEVLLCHDALDALILDPEKRRDATTLLAGACGRRRKRSVPARLFFAADL